MKDNNKIISKKSVGNKVTEKSTFNIYPKNNKIKNQFSLKEKASLKQMPKVEEKKVLEQIKVSGNDNDYEDNFKVIKLTEDNDYENSINDNKFVNDSLNETIKDIFFNKHNNSKYISLSNNESTYNKNTTLADNYDNNSKFILETDNLESGEFVYDGNIKILELIGEGGQGKIYKGVLVNISDESDPVFVAVKRYCYEGRNMNIVERFANECETFRNLKHEHILEYYDIEYFINDSQTIVNIILEYIDGITLKDYIELTKGNCGLNNIRIIGNCILEGLNYLHSNKIIHRDIKVSKIFLKA